MHRVFSQRRRALLLLYALALAPAQQAASQTIAFQDEYAKLIEADQTVAPLTDNLFGDSVSLYNGSTEFVQTDVSLPGNSAIPVSIGRRFAVENRGGGGFTSNRYAFGDWDLEVPYITTIQAAGTNWPVSSSGDPLMRCSGPQSADQAVPPMALDIEGSNPVEADLFWSAPALHVPGAGNKPLLFRGNGAVPAPTDGKNYRWLTKDNWFAACIVPSVDDGSGDGFVVRSPDGLVYYFDHMVKLTHPAVTRKKPSGASSTVNREEVRLYVTRIEDRFDAGGSGKFPHNYVKYTWVGAQLHEIAGNDGRRITLTYNGAGRIDSISDQTRTWTYNYSGVYHTLSSVTLPDQSRWEFGLTALQDGKTNYDPLVAPTYEGPHCHRQRVLPAAGGLNQRSGTITHPSGATGTFVFDVRRHGRTKVDYDCSHDPGSGGDPNFFTPNGAPALFDTLALIEKTITGPGIAKGYTWSYSYETVAATTCGGPSGCNLGDADKDVSVTAPDDSVTLNKFGVRYGENEGQLLSSETFEGSVSRRRQEYAYVTNAEAPLHPFPQQMGHVLNPRVDNLSSTWLRPQKQRLTIQDGVTFRWTAQSFDVFARPVDVARGSSLSGVDRVERTAYHDSYAHWLLGQIASVSTVFSDGSSVVSSNKTYHPLSAQLTQEYSWGKLQKEYSYHANGLLASVTDGAGAAHATALSDYYRGVPRLVQYADGTQERAEVNNLGRITKVYDELNNATTFNYNLTNGRLESMIPPGGDPVSWTATTYVLAKINAPEFGLAEGHWRQTVTTGARKKVVYLDALYRPVVVEEWDTALPAQKRYSVRRFDHAGRETFSSTPQFDVFADFGAVSTGLSTTYDAIGRPIGTAQTAETGTLLTSTTYQPGFKRRVVDARNQATTTSFLAWDEPSYDYPTRVEGPEGLVVAIQRNIWGQTTRLRRDATINGVPMSVNRVYSYDQHKRICRIAENETGSTIMDYDDAGNTRWVASGQPLNLSSTSCLRETVAETAKNMRYYDLRNRLYGSTYPAGTEGVSHTYYPDGALWTISSAGATWTYEYNNRRLLEKETLTYDGKTFVYDWGYDSLGSVASLTYPDGQYIDYAPDAFGRPTKAGSYAANVQYHPNSAVKQFTYGNGVQHSMTQNVRQLPQRATDSKNGTAVIDYGYSYDGNANIASVDDYAQGGIESKVMGYDGLNRLTSASAANLWGSASFQYDLFDNLRRTQVGVRVYSYVYDAARNLPQRIENGAGQTLFDIGHDPRGNLNSKGSQGFTFDAANRLIVATAAPGGSGTETYVYDGHGRRVSVQKSGQSGKRYAVYSKQGQLLHELDAQGKATDYVYLGSTLVARLKDGTPNQALLQVDPPGQTSGNFTLSWTSVLTSGNYQLSVRRDNDPAQNYTIAAPGLSKLFTNPDGGSYDFSLTACAPGNTCSTATLNDYGVTPKPVASIGVPTSPQSGQYTVSWQRSVGARSYRVEESKNSAAYVQLADSPTASLSVSRPGNVAGTYRYRVTALNEFGERAGVISAEVTVPTIITCDNIPSLTTPTISPITLGNPANSYRVQWSASECATAYDLQESPDGLNWSAAPGTLGPVSTTYFDFSSRANGTYYYRVRASRPGNTPVPFSGWSDTRAVTVSVVLSPPIPANVRLRSDGQEGTNIIVYGNNKTVDVLWDSVPDVTHYIVRQATSHPQCSALHGGEYQVPALPPSLLGRPVPYRCNNVTNQPTAYEFTVKACSGANCSLESAIAMVTVESGTGGSGGNGMEALTALQPTYYHTDALGSPVAETNAVGSMIPADITRLRYEPYGVPLNGYTDAPGYTGHVADSHTQLSYMQQRYYDPVLGRFLSADPVAVDTRTGLNFNRYWYANNNPYTYTDPDGRYVEAAFEAASLTLDVVELDSAIQNGSALDVAAAAGILIADAVLAALPLAPGVVGLGVHGTSEVAAVGARLPDEALVVRGGSAQGANSVDGIAAGTSKHHDVDVTGFSVESAEGATFCDLCRNVIHNQVGTTTVGDIRKAGGDVVPTPGKSPTHATVTGLSPDKASTLLTPTQKNPIPKDERRNFD
ncbi:RHS repeat-associated core domain-containing protein [Tahibacter harae]|uniref:Teneurin-like YD-shell domain-containing protein n=1 Tax=Tahibacter harae TaxID=2963937 RepID=A0ABT1QU57_9GAMM|nr:RHS repeat-associated core domain-containing protein [Tahibacter harae]MCQ4165838.1 hypothetical protein [Tahibacter harae]